MKRVVEEIWRQFAKIALAKVNPKNQSHFKTEELSRDKWVTIAPAKRFQ